MHKKYLAILLTLLLAALCGVSFASAQTESADTWRASFSELGLEIALPRIESENMTISHGYAVDESGAANALIVMFYGENFQELLGLYQKYPNPNEEQRIELGEMWNKVSRQLLEVKRFDERELDESAENPAEALTGAKDAIEIGRQEGYVYIAYAPEVDVSDMSENDQAKFLQCRALVPGMIESVQLIQLVAPPSPGDILPAFSSVDLFGNPVTNEIFKGKKVTMINFWGTFCAPCIEEMPDLGELSRDLPEEAQLIGIVIDVSGNQNLALAKEIMEKANADFTNIVPDEALLAYCDTVFGVPTTIFVDENGAVLGAPTVGSNTADAYRAAIMEHLQ